MAYDVVFSYAHADDISPPGIEEKGGWVSIFCEALAIEVRVQLGRHDIAPWNRSLIEAVQSGAVLIVVLSRGYIFSELCRRERQAFMEAVRNQGDVRVFVVAKEWIDPADIPAELRDYKQFPFFSGDEGDWFTFGYPRPELANERSRAAFYDNILKLGREVAFALKNEKPPCDGVPMPKSCEPLCIPPIHDRPPPPEDHAAPVHSSSQPACRAGADQSADHAPPDYTREELQASARKIQFTVYHPREIRPQVWYTLLVYAHIPELRSRVEADARQRLEVPDGSRTAEATYIIMKGAEVVVTPELPGCRFNPPFARFSWLEDWHRVEFRLQSQLDLPGVELGIAVNGRVAFYVESVLVGEVPIWAYISHQADTATADAPPISALAEPYDAIFVSYSHKDSRIVDRLGRAYKMLGMEFLKDVQKLRSGEEWNPALLEMIEGADIFQLYWSRAAKHSPYVEAEWRHALKQIKSRFVRPLYWKLPMPEPPQELAQLHFSYFELEQPWWKRWLPRL